MFTAPIAFASQSARVPGLRKAVQIAATIGAGLLALAATRMPSVADPLHTVVVPASDGYDFDECLATNKTCGQVIADAWCEAHGLSTALSFGRSDDVTASVAPAGSQKVGTVKIEPGSFIVNCKG